MQKSGEAATTSDSLAECNASRFPANTFCLFARARFRWSTPVYVTVCNGIQADVPCLPKGANDEDACVVGTVKENLCQPVVGPVSAAAATHNRQNKSACEAQIHIGGAF
jgi:hypothetical protein